MKKQEILKKIREKRNEIFPDRCKLEFGCKIEITHILDKNGKLYDFSNGVVDVINVVDVMGYDFFGDEEGKMTVLNNFGEIMEFNFGEYFSECRYRILGQPLDIADILRMLLRNNTNPHLEVTSDYFLLIDGIKIDLSKPFKEQSEKVCKKFYNLIK